MKGVHCCILRTAFVFQKSGLTHHPCRPALTSAHSFTRSILTQSCCAISAYPSQHLSTRSVSRLFFTKRTSRMQNSSGTPVQASRLCLFQHAIWSSERYKVGLLSETDPFPYPHVHFTIVQQFLCISLRLVPTATLVSTPTTNPRTKMQITHVLALFAATAAYALPQGLPGLGGLTGGLTGGQNQASPQAAPPESAAPATDPSIKSAEDGSGDHSNVCGNGNKLSCCNSQSNGSLLNVLGSLCSLQVPVIGVPLQSTCGAQQPMCCSTNQDVRSSTAILSLSY